MDFLLEGILSITWQQGLMFLIGGLLIYLGIKKNMEPALLVPMGLGAILVNIPLSGVVNQTMEGVGQVNGIIDWLFRVGIEDVYKRQDFPREQFEKPMERYSAGQRKKVLLAASLADPGALLIWDEPLNYVDVLSRVQVENMLLQDRPTMLFTEHDRAFTDRVATKRLQL